ncbi:MAG: hypothetical protein JW889_02155 [Verrucomicrobia bacterium]|nr:hypothetical protein [Verrucomicrobiota bacterium]
MPLLVMALYALAVGVRWWVCATVEKAWTPSDMDELPYTLEAALLFHYADVYRTTGHIPRVDERVQVPDGLHVWRELSIGKEFLPAWLYNGLGITGMSFQHFVRRFDAAWYALGVIPLFFLVRGHTRSLTGATVAGVVLAVAYTAMQRSTGLEYESETFALPLIFAHFWLFDLAWRKGAHGPSIAAGVVIAIAMAAWDLVQLYVLLVFAYTAVSCLVRRGNAAKLVFLMPTLGALFVAGLVVPYLIAHRFLLSYTMLLGYGLAAWWLIERAATLPAPVAKITLIALVVGALLAASLLPAGQTYGHFRELLLAKLRHLNVKPLDPSRLSFDARILWTPVLHSATTEHVGRVPLRDFRAVLVLSAMAAVLIVIARRRKTGIGQLSLLVTMLLGWFVLYLLFVRMQIFLIFFVAAFIGIGVGAVGTLSRQTWPRVLAVLVFALFFVGDPALAVLVSQPNTTGLPAKQATELLSPSVRVARIYGRRFDYAATERLVAWFRENTSRDDVVLAGFLLEPMIYRYADRPIVLQPKFEIPATREKVRKFLNAFYAQKEQAFHDFCVRNRVKYFVFSPGLFGGPDVMDKHGRAAWIYSTRYVAGAGENYVPGGTRWMYLNKDVCGYFRWVYDVPGEGTLGYAYRIFEVVSEGEIEEALFNVEYAASLFEAYKTDGEAADLDQALDGVLFATELWPGCADAWSLLASIYLWIDRETPGSTRAAEALTRYRLIVAQEERP